MKNWIKETALKTVKTTAQTALATITTVTLLSEVDWLVVTGAVILSGVTCILMNIGSIELKNELESEEA